MRSCDPTFYPCYFGPLAQAAHAQVPDIHCREEFESHSELRGAHLLQPPTTNGPGSEDPATPQRTPIHDWQLLTSCLLQLNYLHPYHPAFYFFFIFFLHFMMSGNSTSEFKHWVYWFFVCWLRGLTSRLFFVPHLKVDAFVKLSRDQSIGHNHDQPWDGKQHQQDENVPTETSRKVNSFFCNKEYVLIPKKTRRDHR